MKIIKLYLRAALAVTFISACADRFGLWHNNVAWGNWDNFLEYTALVNPWFPEAMIPALGALATALELIFALLLLIGFKTKLTAQLSGFLLLIFALSMSFSTGIKTALDASVYSASAAAFALSLINVKYLELDSIISGDKTLAA